jgi:PAS domain S-box-containing protein
MKSGSAKQSDAGLQSGDDLASVRRSNELLRTLIAGTGTGREFFRSLVKNLAQGLRVRYAFVAECLPHHQARSLAFWSGNQAGPDFEYDLQGTPCLKVAEGRTCRYESGLQNLFPDDKPLVEMSAESYLGVPLRDAAQRVIGHLVIMHDKRMPEDPLVLSVLETLAARAGAELERERSSTLLHAIIEGTSLATGREFFRLLVKHAATALRMQNSFVTECLPDNRARSLAYWKAGDFGEDFEYDVTATPCLKVIQGRTCKYEENLAAVFPENAHIREAGLECYVGVPLRDTKRRVIGHLVLTDNKPWHNDDFAMSVLETFAARAGAELERTHAFENLHRRKEESDERYRDLFEEAPIAYVLEGLDSKFIRANRTAMRILGITPDQVEGTFGKDFAPDTPDAQRRMREAFESIGRGTDTSGVVLELRRRDNGKPIWIQWWSRPDPGGTFTRTMFVDITERVLMEQEQARLQAQNAYLQEEIRAEHNFDEIVGNCAALLDVLRQVDQVAPTDSTVLINGETGTGKELIARAIHDRSPRKGRPLVKVNCGAISAGLVESELFGHLKGAFTGALTGRDGRFKLADGGTIFLDEVGELPMDTQVKLLRVLQEQEFEPVGSSETIKVDVRIIAATNRDLNRAIAEGKFRSDLFYRLNVLPLSVPSLRERQGDVPLLVTFFLQRFAKKLGKPIKQVPEDVMQRLVAYPWPGNIRELQNVIERAVVLSTGDRLALSADFAPIRASAAPAIAPLPKAQAVEERPTDAGSLEDVERRHIESVLARTNWMIEGERGAAKILNLNPSTLRSRMQKLGVKRPA